MKESVLYQSELVEIGVFTVDPQEPGFLETGFVAAPIIVFPKNSIWIQHLGSEPFVADASLVNFYNGGQAYQRYAINPAGDYCHWFRIKADLLSEVVAKEHCHFSRENMICPSPVFLQHLLILKLINAAEPPEPMCVEDMVMQLFHDLLLSELNEDITFKRQSVQHKLLVEAVKESLLADLSVNISLRQLAGMHNTSPYHLSRVFKRVSGQGINHYRAMQRLHALTLEMQQHEMELVDLAFDYGFASHSHMSASFKNYFGITPSACQQMIYLANH